MSETKYADRINALLAKAESTHSPEEAEALSAKAEELMIKWGIEEAHLLEAAAKKGERKTGDQIVSLIMDVTGDYHQAWETLARYVMTGLSTSIKPIYTGKDRNYTQITFVGFAGDLSRGQSLFDSLRIQAEDAYKVWWKAERKRMNDSYTGMERFKIKRQFFISFSTAVYNRLVARRAAEVKKAAGTDLVLRNQDQAVTQEFQRMFPRVHKMPNRGLVGNARAREAGHTAGRHATFARGSVDS